MSNDSAATYEPSINRQVCPFLLGFGRKNPAVPWSKSLHRPGPAELASFSFGQSSKVSYRQMITAVSAVVNGGKSNAALCSEQNY